jgi:twitching motility protein PilT
MTRGFVLVTGQTGAGKTTTLASLCKEIIETRPCHVLTIEDPIEFVQESKRASVSQREVGRDAASFASALRAALREDPDVILLGEMRDPESIETALTLAETGHLVFATLHTNDAAQAIDRIIDAVPVAKTNQVRAQLAAGLTAVVSQRLLPRKGGGRQIVVFEVMIATTAVRNLVREGRLNQLARLIATGEREGMVALNTSLATAVAAGDLDEEIALATSADSGGLILQLARLRGGPSH